MTLLPEPVDPAISRCGMVSSAATLDAAVDILAERNGEARVRLRELLGFEHLAQGDQLAAGVGDFDADGGLAGDALDQDGFGLQAQAQILGEGGDAAVLDAGFGLELEGGDHRAGIDLDHVAEHVELFELGLDAAGGVLQFLLVVGIAAGHFVEQIGGRQRRRSAGRGSGGGACGQGMGSGDGRRGRFFDGADGDLFDRFGLRFGSRAGSAGARSSCRVSHGAVRRWRSRGSATAAAAGSFCVRWFRIWRGLHAFPGASSAGILERSRSCASRQARHPPRRGVRAMPIGPANHSASLERWKVETR